MDKTKSVFLIAAIATLSLAALTGCAPAGASPVEEPATISVSGYGDAAGAPDLVSIQLGIQEMGADVGEAVESVNAITEAIRDSVLSLGVEESDVQTTNYSVWPEERFDPESGLPTDERVFRVESTLRITVRDVSVLGDVIDQGLSAGANNVWGISFGLEDPSSLQAEARSAAVLDARARAEQLAEEMDLEIVEVLRVTEGVPGGVYPVDVREAAVGMGGGAPISSGELQVSVQVQVTYAVR